MATIITREVGATAKGTPLSNAEIDNNFINLNTDIATRIPASEKGSVNGVATLDGAGKVVSTQLPSLDYIPTDQKGSVNGVATLGSDGKVPATQLPSYVDDVLEYANLAGFPVTGETSKIYVALDTNKTYRWGGSSYTAIASGSVDSVAGKTGVVTLVAADVGLGNVQNVSALPLTGGTLTGNLNLPFNNVSAYATDTEQVRTLGLNFSSLWNVDVYGSYGTGNLYFSHNSPDSAQSLYVNDNKVLHAGNYSDYAQPLLVSGTSIKTVNGNSILGSGNIQIDGGVTSFNTRTGAVTLNSGDVTTALGFTPLSNAISYLPLSGGNIAYLGISNASAINFRGAGSGTYNTSWIYSDTSITSWEAPITTDSAIGDKVPFILTWRGGYVSQGGLRLTGGSNAELGGNQVIHAGNYSSYALPLSGGTITGNIIAANNTIGAVFGNLEVGYGGRYNTLQTKTSADTAWIQYSHSGPVGIAYGGGTTTVYGPLNVNGVLTTSGGVNSITINSTVSAGAGGVIQLSRASTDKQIYLTWANDNLYIGVPSNSTSARIGSATGTLAFSAGGYDEQATLATNGTLNSTNLTAGGNQVLHAGNYGSYALALSGGTVNGVVRINNQLQVGQNTNGTAIIDAFNGIARFGTDSTSYGLHLDANNYATLQNANGYLQLGPLNSSHAHFQTDRGSFYFNKDVLVDGQLYRYSGSLPYLHSGNYSSYALPLSGGTLSGALNVSRQRLSFSSSYNDANHSIYNNYTNIDGEGVFDGMKMNVYDGLRIRVGNAGGATPLQAFGIDAVGSVWMPRGVTLGSRTNTSTFGGNDTGMSGNSFVAEIRANAAKPTLTFHYENVATTHIEHLSDGSLNVWRPSVEGDSILKIGNSVALHAGNYNSYSPTLTGGGAIGTWGINVTGNAATVGSLAPAQFFNNMGSAHTTYTDFNSVPGFGAYYVQQGNNGPTGVANNQFYGLTLGLGDDYPLSSYGTQLYWPRAAQNADTYLYVRDREGGTWGSWRKTKSGYADTAGSATDSTKLPLTGGTLSGPLVISTGSANNNYNEGLRLTRAENSWAGITFGSTGASGAPTGGWFAATNPSAQFIISPDDSTNTTGLTLNKAGNALWRDSVILHAGNYSSYALPLSGGNLTGGLLIGSNGTTTAYGASSTGKLFFGSSGSDASDNYHIGTTMEDVGGNYSKLDIKWYTGQRFYAAAIYGGFRFHDIVTGAEVFSINKGDSNARVSGNVVFHAGNYSNYALPLTGGTVTGITTFSNASDYQIVLSGAGTSWAGIAWGDGSGTDYTWFNGSTSTFAIGGGGSVVSGKKLHVHGGMTVGANYSATANPTNGLNVEGAIQAGGYLNGSSSFEKLLFASFPQGTANLAADIRFGNLAFWGYIEVEITGSYSNQNSAGKLTKLFAVGTNPGNNVYNNVSRVADVMGTICDNIAIGEFAWDATNSTYRIPISHIVSTSNGYTIKVRMFTHDNGASVVFPGLAMSANYTLTALAAHTAATYNSNLLINGTSQVLHAGNYTSYAAPASHVHTISNITGLTAILGDIESALIAING
jgi:hypothetical protein